MPVTVDGNIIVDGVLASCYASASHDLAHIAMTPFIWFPSVIEWIFGQENGQQSYTGILTKFATLLAQIGQTY